MVVPALCGSCCFAKLRPPRQEEPLAAGASPSRFFLTPWSIDGSGGASKQRHWFVQTGAEKKYTIPSRPFFTEEFEIPAEKVVPEANLFADLALESIDAPDMVGMLEARLDIEVREEDLKTIRTVRDVVDYICRKVEEQGKA